MSAELPLLAEPPLSVWPVAQRNAPAQRSGRYLAVSGQHPAKMLPAIAARAITTYTEPLQAKEPPREYIKF